MQGQNVQMDPADLPTLRRHSTEFRKIKVARIHEAEC